MRKLLILVALLAVASPALADFYEISDGSVKALYHFNDDVVDSSGNGLNGTASNITYASGKQDNGAVFNGSSAKVTVAQSTLLDFENSDYTICWWENSDVTTSKYRVSKTPATSNKSQWTLRTNGSGKIESVISYNVDAGYKVLTNDSALSTGVWYFYCVTHTNSGHVLNNYVNGVDVSATLTSSGSFSSSPASSNMYIGAQFSGNDGWFDGVMDELVFINRVLSSTEITDLYNSGSGLEICTTEGCADQQTGTTTCATSTASCLYTSASSTALTSLLDNDAIESFLLYWFYVVIAFIILTLGYWIIDRFIHYLSGKKY